MLVSEIMSGTPRTVTADTNLIDVVSIMCLYRYSGLPVMEGDKMVGFIAEKDVLHCLFPSLDEVAEGMSGINYDQMMDKYVDVVNLKVRELMATNLVTVSSDMHILRAATVMVRHKFRRIPVMDDGKLVGMLSLGDVHKAIYQHAVSVGMSNRAQ